MNSSCCDRCFPRRCGLLGAVLLLLGAELLWLAVPMPKLCGKAWADWNRHLWKHWDEWREDHPWLEVRQTGLGCSVCNKAKIKRNAWSKFKACRGAMVRKQWMEQHEQSSLHCLAQAQSTDDSVPSIVKGKKVPCAKTFRRVLNQTSSGNHGPEEGVYGRQKLRQLKACLSEAARKLTLVAMSEARSMSLTQDASHGWLALRFSLCNDDLEHRCGAVGVFRIASLRQCHALKIREATDSIIRNFCEPTAPMPLSGSKRTAYTKMYKIITEKVEAMCADAAADEQLAIAMMAGKVHEQVESIFPNLRLRVRDLCHAVRRLGSRPTFADGYLKETMNLFLEGPAKLIEHSDLFKARFSAFVKELSGWSCKSLSAAKHRFESLRTPVARIALHFEAVLRTCEVIMFERRTKKEGKICEHFLENVTVEHALTIACLSDAFDEHMEVTRFCDQEHFDLVALNGKLSGFLKTIAYLFDEDQCWNIHGTYSALMVRRLQSQVLTIKLPSPGGGQSLKRLGGPGVDFTRVIERVTARMKLWTELVRTAMRAEVPDYEIMQTMAMFLGGLENNEFGDDVIQRLANWFQFDPDEMVRQMARLKPVAVGLQRQRDMAPIESWAEAVRREKSSSSPMDTTIVSHVVLRAIAWGFSSSGVERTFSRGAWCKSNREVPEDLATDEVRAVHFPREQQSELIRYAQLEWANHYGNIRKSTPKLSMRKQNLKGNTKTSPWANAASWVRRRREAVRSAVGNSKPQNSKKMKLSKLVKSLRTESHEKEKQFNLQKERKRRILAYQNGLIFKDGKRLRRESAEYEKQQNERRSIYFKDVAKRDRAVDGPNDSLEFVDMKVMIPGPTDTEKLRRAVAECGARVMRGSQVNKTNVIIQQDPTRPKTSASFAAFLFGMYIASPRFFYSKGTKGMLIPFKRSSKTQRRVAWVSPEFRALHPHAAGWIDAAPSPWIIMADKAKFVERARRFRTVASLATAFVSEREQRDDQDLKNILYKVTAEDAVNLFLDIDGTRKMVRIWSSHKK